MVDFEHMAHKSEDCSGTRGRRFFCLLQSSRALDCAKIPPSLMQFRQLIPENEQFFVFVGACVGVGQPSLHAPRIYNRTIFSCIMCAFASVAHMLASLRVFSRGDIRLTVCRGSEVGFYNLNLYIFLWRSRL